MNILHVVGARPNFMKVAPVMAAIAERNFARQVLVHTGQHYDANMSDIFFQQLGLPQPDINLGVGSGTHSWQTAQIMIHFEKVVLDHRPDLVLVYGDVNSTVAAALVCAKQGVRLGHVEAGLRSFDRTMPEEINRILTDQLADLLFTPSEDGNENLLREGIAPEKIHLVGNVMIDSLKRLLPQATSLSETLRSKFNVNGKPYGMVTLHRPSNVDDSETLARMMASLEDISHDLTLIFPVHPRTRQRLVSLRYQPASEFLKLVEPLSYLEFLAMIRHTLLVITDSGGIQEETTFLGVPCLSVRENTERPATVNIGTNLLVGQDMERVRMQTEIILSGRGKKGRIPEFWDGRTGERIASKIGEMSF